MALQVAGEFRPVWEQMEIPALGTGKWETVRSYHGVRGWNGRPRLLAGM